MLQYFDWKFPSSSCQRFQLLLRFRFSEIFNPLGTWEYLESPDRCLDFVDIFGCHFKLVLEDVLRFLQVSKFCEIGLLSFFRFVLRELAPIVLVFFFFFSFSSFSFFFWSSPMSPIFRSYFDLYSIFDRISIFNLLLFSDLSSFDVIAIYSLSFHLHW